MISVFNDDEEMFCVGACYTCKRTMSFNPNLVPSLPRSVTSTGEKEPVCRSCIEKANPKRVERGLAPIEILEGAYYE